MQDLNLCILRSRLLGYGVASRSENLEPSFASAMFIFLALANYFDRPIAGPL